jgi:ATP-binding cassette subfamily B multidrug efflux pump
MQQGARTTPDSMFALFERLLRPTDTPEHPEPPAGLIAFFLHFARQAKWLFAAHS